MSSVRFICGTQDIHKELETKIADFLGTENPILYAAAFDANGGVFEPLFGDQDAIISDELNHASIIDGCRLSKAKIHVFPHKDAARAAQILAELENVPGRKLLIYCFVSQAIGAVLMRLIVRTRF